MSKKELRARRRKNAERRSACPTPSKTGFPSQQAAVENLIRHGYTAGRTDRDGQGIYLCVCGTYHRTSKPGSTLVRQFSPSG